MSTAYIIAAKNGDILNVLRIVQPTDSSTVNIVVSKQYASVLEGIPWVKAHIWNGDWQDLRGAIKWAKTQFKRVLVPQTFGHDYPVHRKAPSFTLDQQLRCGVEPHDRILDLPRPANAKELVNQYFQGRRAILFADKSQSSPFPYRDELLAMLDERFPEHKIVTLSDIRLPNIKDFLALMDAADVIVSVETAFLHLTAAARTPVVALVTDKPQRWHGTAWHQRFAMHMRYGDFQAQKNSLMMAVDNAVNKTNNLTPRIIPTEHEHGYNPSVVKHSSSTLVTYRFHPVKSHWRTEIAITDGIKTWTIRMPKDLDGYSIEDGRCFHYQDKLWMSYTVARTQSNLLKCVIGYGELRQDDQGWFIDRHIQPRYGNNDFSGMNKNWIAFVVSGKLYFIYSSEPHQTIIQVDGDKVISEHKTEAPKWDYGIIRGGTIVPWGERLLRIFHSRTGNGLKPYEFKYHIGAEIMEPSSPFAYVKVSSHPIISGNERYVHDCSHWKANVIICYGVIKEADEFIVSVGLNDSMCAMLRLKESDLNL